MRSRNKENKESYSQAEALHCFLECPHSAIDNDSNPQRRTTIIGHELRRYGIDIAAVSEIRIHGELH